MSSRLLALCLVVAPACGHRAPARQARAAAPAPAPSDFAQLGDVDVRLLTEALAYDVTHSPWMQGLQAVQNAAGGLPRVAVGTLPDQVPPSAAPFPRALFASNLVQSLRNTHRVEVENTQEDSLATRQPTWRLDVTATHDSLAVEGDMSRGYLVTAVLRLVPGNTTAWQKSYTLRKRMRPEAQDGDAHPNR